MYKPWRSTRRKCWRTDGKPPPVPRMPRLHPSRARGLRGGTGGAASESRIHLPPTHAQLKPTREGGPGAVWRGRGRLLCRRRLPPRGPACCCSCRCCPESESACCCPESESACHRAELRNQASDRSLYLMHLLAQGARVAIALHAAQVP
jgi:hypothetical protein